MGNALNQRQAFDRTMKAGRSKCAQCLFGSEIGLIEVGIEIAAHHEALNHRHGGSDHVAHVIEDLVDRYLAFADVLVSLRSLIALHDEVALKMERVNTHIRPCDLEPGKGEPP